MVVSGMRFVIFDLETTGLDPKHHQPIQIGAIAVDGGTLREIEEFEIKIRFDESRAAPEALAIRPTSEDAWERFAVSEREAAREFSAFLKRHATARRETANGKPFLVAELAAYNAPFDVPFLQSWYDRLGDFLPAAFHGRCLMQRAMWYYFEAGLPPPPSWKLGTLCEAFGVSLGENAHDALHDARATAALYRRIIAGGAPRVLSRPRRKTTLRSRVPGRRKTRARRAGHTQRRRMR